MRRILAAITLGLIVAAGTLSFAAPSTAAPARAGTVYSADILSSVQTSTPAASTPSPSVAPSDNPVNPGTGEPAESEANRTNYAPYVIGAVVVITLVLALFWWRRRGNKTVV
ncbi:LuxR family transcriptional regulator [Arthrobacter sp. ISL-5]|uniref:LuxR family transcriptional regulator n=1 Tax=Arthrobacter sp. ISL-5 TaxID=2819111 RepID=UPI001BE9194C|nr:LuxR family transcriptional regulator [Arthrobacter sp. ISL-5]MBT2554097.1 LuxR family transcriptional regulator [Arthrobacter sp. ISL-5]